MHARPEKLSHRDTVIYEIDMLDYCYQKLVQKKRPLKKCEGYALLECFLLHYRNLIDFFGKEPRRDDLSISEPQDWVLRPPIAENEIQALKAKGQDLWQEYESREKRMDTISRYLQHCTKQRTEPKSWRVEEMFGKLSPLIEAFQRLLGDCHHVAVDNGEFVVGPAGAHTATIQRFNFTDEGK